MSRILALRLSSLVILLVTFAVAGWLGGLTFAPDVAAIQKLQEWRVHSPRLTMAMITLTQLGSAYVTFGGGLAVSALLLLQGHRRRAVALAALVVGERLLVDGLKLLLDRARPAFDAHPVLTHSSSFPSGHSGNSMAVFLGIALIAAPERWRREAIVAAVLLSMVIGFSRPFLGVHWPTDVVGGWALGATVAMIAARFASLDVKRGGTAA